MGQSIRYQTYTPVGDVIVISICLVMMILIVYSYIKQTKSYRIFLTVMGLVMLAAYANILLHVLARSHASERTLLLYTILSVYHAILFGTFLAFILYICEVTNLDREQRQPYVVIGTGLFFLSVLADAMDIFVGGHVAITESGIVFRGNHDQFMYSYLAFVILIIFLMVKIRKRLYKRVMMGFYGSMAISFIVLAIQSVFSESSFTVATFLFPVIAMFYIMHSNPYDVQLGALNLEGFLDTVRLYHARKKPFMFMSLYLRELDEEGSLLPDGVKDTIRRFTTDYFRGAILFRVSSGHAILLFSEKRNPDSEQRISRILSDFDAAYEKFQYDYKVVIGKSIDQISEKNEYVSFIQDVHRGMAENTVYRIVPEDVDRFKCNEYILKELDDIFRKQDMDDPRVLAFCQPVYNIRTGKYDTAEALMRLNLPETGMVFPDVFIPLAEENGYIHALTKIILHKTCEAIRKLIEEGYEVCRISVNVSALELRDDGFCDDMISIINRSEISGDRIAIELTESRSESDFLLMQHKIFELKERGVTFYLDDFGTGYSNVERIMELPFDIIKFDRSLVQSSGSSERSRKIVNGMASMFAGMDYSVLYEGVEDASDEEMCIRMSASYLQGYRYSRPVPIEQLEEFLEKDEKSAS